MKICTKTTYFESKLKTNYATDVNNYATALISPLCDIKAFNI